MNYSGRIAEIQKLIAGFNRLIKLMMEDGDLDSIPAIRALLSSLEDEEARIQSLQTTEISKNLIISTPIPTPRPTPKGTPGPGG